MPDSEQPVSQDETNNFSHTITTNPPTAAAPEHTPSTVDVQVAVADEDAMDTTPDPDASSVEQTDSNDSQETPSILPDPVAHPANTTIADQPVNEDSLPAGEAIHAVCLTSSSTQFRTTDIFQSQVDNPAQAESSAILDALLQPPPPPPPVDILRASDVSDSEDEDGVPSWHPIQEDTSSPDEEELKEINASTEYSALDHEHWEGQAFLPLEEPEYSAGATGRIEWTVDAYNGTREKPNHEVVMKSDPVSIGGHLWQIKFYPKGNDSDYLSVYLECLSVMNPKPVQADGDSTPASSSDGMEPDKEAESQMPVGQEGKADASVVEQPRERDHLECTTPVALQHAPLPLLKSKVLPKRKSVAAQVSVVLYNPAEPRVHYSKTALHRFCGGSPDWGWTRFHGPYYDIAHRVRGQRQALLRDDKLAFTGYVRIIDDQTDCLWEHHSRDNPWDSFAMTGLQGLMLGENASAPGGNMISAIASWMLFKPFRGLLYSIDIPNPETQPFIHPKPLLSALQKVLYMLRTHVDPGAGPVPLDDVLDALEWYHINTGLDKLDVIEIWEILRSKLEEELQDTLHAATLHNLFGPKRDYSTSHPAYRIPVADTESIQAGIDRTPDFAPPSGPLPQMLTIELDRQIFDAKTRSYVKLVNRVMLDESISVNGTAYTLFGFVVHKQTLQSYVYQPIFRPEGPGTKWYSYSDSKDENHVQCLAKRQAIDAHEGKQGNGHIVGNDPIAYIAIYIRDDVKASVFTVDADSEQWEVPSWLAVEEEEDGDIEGPRIELPTVADLTPAVTESQSGTTFKEPPSREIEFRVLTSKVYDLHNGPGLFDAYDSRWLGCDSSYTYTVQLHSSDSCEKIRDKLAATLSEVQDVRQVKFWFLDPVQGSHGRPNLLSSGKIEFSCGEYLKYLETKDWELGQFRPVRRGIWVHIIDLEKLPKLPAEPEKQKADIIGSGTGAIATEAVQQAARDEVAAEDSQPQLPLITEDTPMSEPNEPPTEQTSPPSEHLPEPPLNLDAAGNDITMSEVQQASIVEIIPVRPTEHDTVVPVDTEMTGTLEDLPPPPPPPLGLVAAELLQPPPVRSPSPEPPAEDVYFFLKYWEPSTQTLHSRGSHVVARTAKVDESIASILGLPAEDKKKIEMWEEEDAVSVRSVKHRRTFAQLNLRNTAVLVVGHPQSVEQRSALAERAAFADLQAYLTFQAFARNFGHKVNGHFTYNYFSSQYYKGEIKNGQRHGQGSCIYHSGAKYEGTFRLGQRHGHGLYTFQNGDTYDGDWVDDQQHGSGTFVEAATGNTYTGGWKNDKKFGEGVTHWKNAQEAERMCRICWDEPAEAAFYDCGHVVACLTCAREVQNCPVCRKRVLTAMKLYYVA